MLRKSLVCDLEEDFVRSQEAVRSGDEMHVGSSEVVSLLGIINWNVENDTSLLVNEKIEF